MNDVEQLRQTLAKIAELASAASNGLSPGVEGTGGHEPTPADIPGCSVKPVPKRLLIKAAEHARRINPINAPQAAPYGGDGALGVMEPLSIAVLTQKYWGPTPRQLTVSFMETTPADLRKRIVEHMNAWTRTGCISFVETGGTGDVRITRSGSGYWSYLGTDVQLIPKNRPTMCLQAFTMNTPESEYRRVVRHETGHTLGFPHEHMRKELIARIDPRKAYDYFLTTQGWDKATVDAQVLTPLDAASILGTPPDQTSIMCYQLPASITKDRKPIVGGLDINSTDFAFVGRIYPKPGATVPASGLMDGGPQGGSEGGAEDWSEDEDIQPGE